MEEGEFNNDELNDTFGRRIYMKGDSKIGWFLGGGYQLHGYGMDSKSSYTGIFEEGMLKN